MPIPFTCRYCKFNGNAPDKAARHMTLCPRCRQKILVPNSEPKGVPQVVAAKTRRPTTELVESQPEWTEHRCKCPNCGENTLEGICWGCGVTFDVKTRAVVPKSSVDETSLATPATASDLKEIAMLVGFVVALLTAVVTVVVWWWMILIWMLLGVSAIACASQRSWEDKGKVLVGLGSILLVVIAVVGTGYTMLFGPSGLPENTGVRRERPRTHDPAPLPPAVFYDPNSTSESNRILVRDEMIRRGARADEAEVFTRELNRIEKEHRRKHGLPE
jgi:hypothetical protein